MKTQIPIYIAKVLPLMALGFSLTVSAKTLITSTELNKLVEQIVEQNQQSLIQRWLPLNADAIEEGLSAYPQVQQTWLRKLLIEQLRQIDTPTPAQYQWVKQQTNSNHILYSHLPDTGHEHALSVVNIPAQAKGLINRWQSIKTAQKWLADIEQNRFEWPTLIEELAELNRAPLAVDYFLKAIPANQHTTLIDGLLALKGNDALSSKANLPKTIPSNLLISKMLMLSEDHHQQQLYQWLWSKPADEFSIATLQAVVNNNIGSDNIKQLKLATNNSELTSLGLNLMASHYGHEPAVIDFLFTLLGQDHKSAYAAAALAKSTSPQVKQRLSQGLHSPDNQRRKASQLALQLSQQQQ